MISGQARPHSCGPLTHLVLTEHEAVLLVSSWRPWPITAPPGLPRARKSYVPLRWPLTYFLSGCLLPAGIQLVSNQATVRCHLGRLRALTAGGVLRPRQGRSPARDVETAIGRQEQSNSEKRRGGGSGLGHLVLWCQDQMETQEQRNSGKMGQAERGREAPISLLGMVR